MVRHSPGGRAPAHPSASAPRRTSAASSACSAPSPRRVRAGPGASRSRPSAPPPGRSGPRPPAAGRARSTTPAGARRPRRVVRTGRGAPGASAPAGPSDSPRPPRHLRGSPPGPAPRAGSGTPRSHVHRTARRRGRTAAGSGSVPRTRAPCRWRTGEACPTPAPCRGCEPHRHPDGPVVTGQPSRAPGAWRGRAAGGPIGATRRRQLARAPAGLALRRRRWGAPRIEAPGLRARTEEDEELVPLQSLGVDEGSG